ncbi:hypothetical protein HELRODRAFT_176916 [Helobdella robusta]|uniref:Uncharacterized protein n=1 Tax=Helobdella robusta TaxID=6412 RepID=T1FB17_HELRO|nr:hypothetical protein HELRODRAFT_176916 [Helobdella robusta]ESN98443.1 hypothetical protein HELRODRAFT_176916 [Helobdella robusta]
MLLLYCQLLAYVIFDQCGSVASKPTRAFEFMKKENVRGKGKLKYNFFDPSETAAEVNEEDEKDMVDKLLNFSPANFKPVQVTHAVPFLFDQKPREADEVVDKWTIALLILLFGVVVAVLFLIMYSICLLSDSLPVVVLTMAIILFIAGSVISLLWFFKIV